MMPAATPRDVDFMRLLYRLGLMTIEHAETCVYGNRNVTQRRLSVLEAQGYLLSFPLSRGRKGQPTKVCFLNHKERHVLSQMLQQELDEKNIPKKSPDNSLVAWHMIELNSVLVAFIAAAKAKGCLFDFVPEYWSGAGLAGGSPLADEVQNPHGGAGMIRYRRDAVCCIGTQKGKALFEIEYDRGKEAIQGTSSRKVSVANKIVVFLQSLKERRFERYAGPQFFNHPFKVSRLLLVTSSAERLQNIIAVCQELNTHGLVYLTMLEQVCPETILGCIWQVPDAGTIATRSLVNNE